MDGSDFPGKGGAKYGLHGAVCLEPQVLPCLCRCSAEHAAACKHALPSSALPQPEGAARRGVVMINSWPTCEPVRSIGMHAHLYVADGSWLGAGLPQRCQ